jgi:hypothetical protein
MLIIILCLIVLVVGQVLIIIKSDDLFETIIGSIILYLLGGIVAFCICISFIPMTGGLYRGYSEGNREGYVTKISERGIIWKTWEAQIQVGTGEMAALQSPYEFSIPKDKKELYLTIRDSLGKKVNIEYTQWLLMPYWVGSSGVELTSIKQIK